MRADELRDLGAIDELQGARVERVHAISGGVELNVCEQLKASFKLSCADSPSLHARVLVERPLNLRRRSSVLGVDAPRTRRFVWLAVYVRLAYRVSCCRSLSTFEDVRQNDDSSAIATRKAEFYSRGR